MKNEHFVIERIYNAPSKLVWEALTDNEKVKQWYFKFPEFKAEVGFEFEFRGGPTPDRLYIHHCKITEVIPGKKLTYSWNYVGYAGTSYVSFELFPENGKTKLRLTHDGLETFPANNPDFAKSNFAEGWTHIIGIALKEFVEKN